MLRAVVALGLLPLLVAAGDDVCRLCAPKDAAQATAELREVPISIDITTQLDFSRAALSGWNGGVIELDPNFGRGYGSLGIAYLKAERYPEALAELKRAVELSPNDRQLIRDLGYAFGVSGRRDEALGVLRTLQAKYEKREAFGGDVAAVYLGLGDKDQAFAWIEKDLQARSGRLGRVFYQVPFESLRDDPRYADLRRRMGMPQ